MIRVAISFYLIIVLLSGCQKEELTQSPPEEYHAIKVMTYNVLFSTSDEPTLEVLTESGANIVGLQEARLQGLRNWHRSLAIISTAFPRRREISANFPGNTWTTMRAEDEVYDRIDMVYHTVTPKMNLADICTVGGRDDAAGIAVANYPSDHYGVVATYLLEN